MKNGHKLIFCLLISSLANPVYAGKWVNWGAIVEDIQDGIRSAVDFVVDKVLAKPVKIVASGISSTKEIALVNVDAIDIVGAGTLIVTQNDEQEGRLVIEADQVLMPYIETEIKDKKLIIKIKDNVSFNVDNKKNNNLTYHVSVKNLTQVNLAGAVSGMFNSIKTESLLLDVAGASQLVGDITVDSLIIKSAGASRIVLSGNALMQNMDVSGSCKVDCRNVVGKLVVAQVSGASAVYCNASNVLSGYVSEISSLYYVNNPVVLVKSSGVATVQKL